MNEFYIAIVRNCFFKCLRLTQSNQSKDNTVKYSVCKSPSGKDRNRVRLSVLQRVKHFIDNETALARMQ